MKKIYKYELGVKSSQVVMLPKGAKILSVQAQYDSPCLWALVDPDMPNDMPVTIRIFGTGHEIPDSDRLEYIGTVQVTRGLLVWHFFKEI